MSVKAHWALSTTASNLDTVQSAALWDSWARSGTNTTSRGSDGYLTSYAANTPRWEYDSSGNLLGLLVENAKTEKMLSGQTDVGVIGGWSFLTCTNQNNPLSNPYGTANAADTITDLNDGTWDLPYATHGCTLTTGIEYTVSAFLKCPTPGTSSGGWAYIQFVSYSGVTAYAMFDVENGVLGDMVGTQAEAYGMEPYNDGWYRCWITADIQTDAVGAFRIGMTDNGTATSNYYSDGKVIGIWGVQAEQTSRGTGFGPTSFSVGSRVGDVPAKADISGWYSSDTANSAYFKAYRYQDERIRSTDLFEIYYNFSNFTVFRFDSSWRGVLDKNGTTFGDDTTTAYLDDTPLSFAARLATNDMAIANSLDTDPLTPDAAVGWPPVIEYLNIQLGTFQGGLSGPNFGNGYIIQDIVIYDTGLTDAELIDLATNGLGAATFPGTVAGDGGVIWPARANDPRWAQIITDSGITATGNFQGDVKLALLALSGQTRGGIDDLWKRTLIANSITDYSEPFLY